MIQRSLLVSSFKRPQNERLSRLPFSMVIILSALVLPVLAPAPAQARRMKLLTLTTGWVTRLGHLYWTRDSGSDWTDITPVPPGIVRGGVKLDSVFFLDTQQGWAVVSYPQTVAPLTLKALRTRKTLYDIAQTVDGGQTWSFLPLTYPELPQWEQEALAGPRDMNFLDSLHGWLIMAMSGSSNFAPARLLATDDGGKSWKWTNSPDTTGTLLFTSTQNGWLAGGPGGLRLYATYDGCKTWHEIDLAPPPQFNLSPQAVFEGPPAFVDARHAFVAARYEGLGGARSRLIVFSTADAGKTWTVAKVLEDSWEGGELPVAFADSVLIVPSGASAKAMHIEAAPLSGEAVSKVVVSGNNVLELTFADPQHGLALDGDAVLYTSDGGAAWRNVTPKHVSRLDPASRAPTVQRSQVQVELTHPNTSLLLTPEASAGGGRTGGKAILASTLVSTSPALPAHNTWERGGLTALTTISAFISAGST